MIHQPTDRQKWFRERIEKIVWRNETSCKCAICKNVFENGLYIQDLFHADYVYDCECESNGEGTPLRYFDSKEQVDEWLKSLPNGLDKR